MDATFSSGWKVSRGGGEEEHIARGSSNSQGRVARRKTWRERLNGDSKHSVDFEDTGHFKIPVKYVLMILVLINVFISAWGMSGFFEVQRKHSSLLSYFSVLILFLSSSFPLLLSSPPLLPSPLLSPLLSSPAAHCSFALLFLTCWQSSEVGMRHVWELFWPFGFSYGLLIG